MSNHLSMAQTQAIQALAATGKSKRAISRALGIDRGTVAKILSQIQNQPPGWEAPTGSADVPAGFPVSGQGAESSVLNVAESEVATSLTGITAPSSLTAEVRESAVASRSVCIPAHVDTATEERIASLGTEANGVMNDLFRHRCELTKRRSDFVQLVLADNQHVRVGIQSFGERATDSDREYRQRLGCDDERFRRDILTEDGANGVLSGLYQSLPEDSIARQVEVGQRIQQLKQDTLQMAQTGTSTEKCTQRFANFLKGLDPHVLDIIETWWPEDNLLVDYRRSGTAERWLPIEQGSPGQQTAAMLAFILSYGNQPIILDQPEDDLDNHLIYDLIVQQIRDTKRSRQIIIATHNPNIVVNGDAEKVLAMDVVNSQCVVLPTGSGCLQETRVRDEICRVMEGGRRAFQQRYRRIFSEVADA